MGIEVMGKWEWECSGGLGMGGNGNDLMGVGTGKGMGTRKSFLLTSSSQCHIAPLFSSIAGKLHSVHRLL